MRIGCEYDYEIESCHKNDQKPFYSKSFVI